MSLFVGTTELWRGEEIEIYLDSHLFSLPTFLLIFLLAFYGENIHIQGSKYEHVLQGTCFLLREEEGGH